MALESEGPLTGTTVVEFGHVIAGPYAGLILADLGADVIKLEDVRHPDESRITGPHFADDQSLYYLSLNWGKRSIAIDLARPYGQRLALEVAASADVVLDNFRHGVVARLGIDHESLKAVNPAIITCSITGFGETGPYANRPGYDYTIQALSGIMSLTGEPGTPPARAGIAYADHTGGLASALAICAALVERDRSGIGRHIDLSLLDVQVSMLSYLAAWQLATGAEPQRMPSSSHASLVPAQNFATADGTVSLFVGNDYMWQRFVRELADPALADPRYATNALRAAHRDEVAAIIESTFQRESTEHWVDRLNRAGVACAPVNSVSQTMRDPHVIARGMIQSTTNSAYGAYRHVAGPIRSMGSGGARGGPRLGQDSASILLGLGYDPDRIEALIADGALLVGGDRGL